MVFFKITWKNSHCRNGGIRGETNLLIAFDYIMATMIRGSFCPIFEGSYHSLWATLEGSMATIQPREERGIAWTSKKFVGADSFVVVGAQFGDGGVSFLAFLEGLSEGPTLAMS